jgi:hypothetical protein
MGRGAASGAIDTQTVTSGADGTAGAGDRRRGYLSATIGSISPGTTTLGGGTVVTEFYWNELLATYTLTVTGAANSGWTTVDISGANPIQLLRTAATFSGGTWTWGTVAPVVSQVFGAAASVHTCAFN